MKIEIEKPHGNACTGCPMSNLLFLSVGFYYGCNYLHKEMKAGGKHRNYGIKDKDCPFLKERANENRKINA